VRTEPVVLDGDIPMELAHWAAKNDVDLVVFGSEPNKIGLAIQEFSLFSDYSGYAAVRLKKVGLSALYGYNSVGSLRSPHGGGVLSFEGWSTPLILRVSAGYVITPLLAAEVEMRREGAGVRAVAISRPGIYVDLSLFSYVKMDRISVGGMYRTSGNTFGIFLTYSYGGNAFSLLFSTHESLGESVFSDNLMVF